MRELGVAAGMSVNNTESGAVFSHFLIAFFRDRVFSGFSVNASSERLNMGEIETMEDF